MPIDGVVVCDYLSTIRTGSTHVCPDCGNPAYGDIQSCACGRPCAWSYLQDVARKLSVFATVAPTFVSAPLSGAVRAPTIPLCQAG